MSRQLARFFVERWRAELLAAEMAADRISEFAHRALARRYARLAADAYARMQPCLGIT